ncbi:MAG: UDP-2,4-diacetamido-2,4,6-trideoxy-beta-L-altropyranose hydrolase [Desulfitobacterium hafniense]|nr:UDP-2,4-diacetamido-2,4,6-trideoxy-beta-L-altropyranose hydrolase [Desulfitobacterium hafniense]
MYVVIRVDASLEIGTGHVMRCLTLADELKMSGAEVIFLSRLLPGNLNDYIRGRGYTVYALMPPSESLGSRIDKDHTKWLGVPWERDAKEVINLLRQMAKKADWLIIDSYSIDSRWERRIRSAVKRILVIDDLADRAHECDALLDQNFVFDMLKRYESLVPAECKLLLGPKYALLRPEFTHYRNYSRSYLGSVKRLLVFYGGVDLTNETSKAIEAISLLDNKNIQVDVVVGQGNPHKEKISKICQERDNFNYYCQVKNMADLMVKADMALGAGGSTMWERCFVGLPCVTTIVAANQDIITRAVADFGAVYNLGWYEDVSVKKIEETLKVLLSDKDKLTKLQDRSKELMCNKKNVSDLLTTINLWRNHENS